MPTEEDDLNRLLRAARKGPDDAAPPDWVYDISGDPALLAASGMRLKPVQAKTLVQVNRAGGLLANIGVGGGKTLITGLLPQFVDLPRPDVALFVPASALAKTEKELIEYWNAGFAIYDRLHLFTYNQASSMKHGIDALEALNPGAIIFDECHMISNRNAVRTDRLMQLLLRRRDILTFHLSGTLMKKGVADFCHLAYAAFAEASPLPILPGLIGSFDKCLSRDLAYGVAGRSDWKRCFRVLEACDKSHGLTFEAYSKLPEEQRRVMWRDGLNHWLETSVGVVFTTGQSTDKELIIDAVNADQMTADVSAIVDLEKQVRTFWERPDGEIFISGLEVSRCCAQISVGFYYYWDWGESGPDRAWLDLRADWRSKVRQIVSRRERHLDTDGFVYKDMRATLILFACVQALVERALAPRVLRYFVRILTARVGESALQALRAYCRVNDPDVWSAWEAWIQALDRTPQPPTLAEWVDTGILDEVYARLLHAEGPTLVWTEHKEVLTRLAEDPRFQGLLEIAEVGKSPPPFREQHLALSIQSHGVAHNLQEWRYNIVIDPPGANARAEQLLGRTHRYGQTDTVHAAIFTHTYSSKRRLFSAETKAKTVAATTGQPQRLTHATWRTPLGFIEEGNQSTFTLDEE